MMKKVKILALAFVAILPAQDVLPSNTKEPSDIAEWTVLTFVEARNNLHSFAKENIRAMAKVGSTNKANLLVQWYQPGKAPWRYKIEKGKTVSVARVEGTSRGSFRKDLVGAMEWAVTTHPAKHYCLILWNHGLGIIDPQWTSDQPYLMGGNGFMSGPGGEGVFADMNNPRTQIQGITVKSARESRGILFNEIDRTYMTNKEMIEAFEEINTRVLKGKKIDIVGMDACLMAMMEVGYQLRKSAQMEPEINCSWF